MTKLKIRLSSAPLLAGRRATMLRPPGLAFGCVLSQFGRACQRRAHVVTFCCDFGVGMRVASKVFAAKAIRWITEMAPSTALDMIVRLGNPLLEASELLFRHATVVLADHVVAAVALFVVGVALDSPRQARVRI